MTRDHTNRDDKVDLPDIDALIAQADAKFAELPATDRTRLRRDAERAERDRQDGEANTTSRPAQPREEITPQHHAACQETTAIHASTPHTGRTVRPPQRRDGRTNGQNQPGQRTEAFQAKLTHRTVDTVKHAAPTGHAHVRMSQHSWLSPQLLGRTAVSVVTSAAFVAVIVVLSVLVSAALLTALPVIATTLYGAHTLRHTTKHLTALQRDAEQHKRHTTD